MPVHEINLDMFKDDILSWFNNGVTSKDIVERIIRDHKIVCTNCTIQQRLRQ